ncbi:MAG: dehydrase and lipid transport-domain-containing protein [Benniella sp.]|nr:MAG: dehydrase and lipid transport-domain-containing protein [Benniella sp.]
MLRLARGPPSFPPSLLCTLAKPRSSSCPHPSSLPSNTAVLPCLRRRFIALPKLPDLPNLLRPASSRQYKDSIVVKYSQQEFYDLVADVDQYHQFLPWCTYSKMSTTTPSSPPAGSDRRVQVGPGPVTVRHGELGIGFNSLQERYVSTVTCQEPWTVRAVSYDSKLFKELSTTWRFTPDIPKSTTLEATMDQELQERQLLTRRESKGSASPSNLATMKPSDYPSCLVDFEIQFEFASAMHASMSSLFFDQVSKEMLKAFIHRAEILYGKR